MHNRERKNKREGERKQERERMNVFEIECKSYRGTVMTLCMSSSLVYVGLSNSSHPSLQSQKSNVLQSNSNLSSSRNEKRVSSFVHLFVVFCLFCLFCFACFVCCRFAMVETDKKNDLPYSGFHGQILRMNRK
jgi:hypothetical protein